MYTTFIRPVIEYADVIWDNCSKGEKTELDKIQTEAARIATGTNLKTYLFEQFVQIDRLAVTGN
jgi:hypothetical protein